MAEEEKNPNTEIGIKLSDGTNVQIPLLTIKKIPSLQVDEMDIIFDMAVKESDAQK